MRNRPDSTLGHHRKRREKRGKVSQSMVAGIRQTKRSPFFQESRGALALPSDVVAPVGFSMGDEKADNDNALTRDKTSPWSRVL